MNRWMVTTSVVLAHLWAQRATGSGASRALPVPQAAEWSASAGALAQVVFPRIYRPLSARRAESGGTAGDSPHFGLGERNLTLEGNAVADLARDTGVGQFLANPNNGGALCFLQAEQGAAICLSFCQGFIR